jgi:DNA-binding LacI/PurR family transcriptional regulator
MASIRDIAKQVGVSPATVSRALNNRASVGPELRTRILRAVSRSRYVPRVGVRSTANVALVYTGESSIESPFDGALMRGLHHRLEENGFDLMILSLAGRGREAGEDYSHLFMQKGIRGVILRTTTPARHICEQIAAQGFPAVVVGERFDNSAVNYVYSESRKCSREAVQHLIDLGHRRIGLAINVTQDSDHDDRMAGYRDALQGAQMALDDRLIFRVTALRQGGVQLIRRIGAMPDRPTAVYIADPMTAIGAMGEAQVVGLKVPEDLSIVGFDDGELRFFVYPQMTAVCQDAAKLGRDAVEALLRLMSPTNQAGAVRIALPTVFEVHGSTAPPK